MATLAEIFDVPATTKGTLIVPNKIEALITGATMALVEAEGRVTLHYSDGTLERTELGIPEAEVVGRYEGQWFDLVSAVKSLH